MDFVTKEDTQCPAITNFVIDNNKEYAKDLSMAIDQIEQKQKIEICVIDGRIVISGTDQKPEIFSLTGVRMNGDLKRGIYIVKVGNVTKKITI